MSHTACVRPSGNRNVNSALLEEASLALRIIRFFSFYEAHKLGLYFHGSKAAKSTVETEFTSTYTRLKNYLYLIF